MAQSLIKHYNFTSQFFDICIKKVKWSRYRAGVAQRVGRGIALLSRDHGTRWGWVVSSTPRPHFTPGKDPVPILQEAGWAAGLVWMGGKSRPHWDSIPDHPAHSQSLYRLSYPAHSLFYIPEIINLNFLPGERELHSSASDYSSSAHQSSSRTCSYHRPWGPPSLL